MYAGFADKTVRSLENACHHLSTLEVCLRQGAIHVYLTLPYITSSLIYADSKSKIKLDIAVRNRNYHTATRNHMPYEITQCYLPPGRGDFPAFTPAKAGTRYFHRTNLIIYSVLYGISN